MCSHKKELETGVPSPPRFVNTPACAVKGCGKDSSIGTRLCLEHLNQAECAHSAARSEIETTSKDPYDVLVSDLARKIGNSEQMRGVALQLIEGGVRDAVDSFPELSEIPEEIIEQLTSFMAVNVVSAIIQERSHLLARAMILAEALPKDQAEGIRKLVELEMEAVSNPIESGFANA